MIGIIGGYYPETVNFSIPAATVLTGQVHDNSGIAVVVPVSQLLDLLKSPAVQSNRDSQVSLLTKH